MSSTVRVSVADQQLRQFKLGLQALARIGHELLIEALPGKVMRPGDPATSSWLGGRAAWHVGSMMSMCAKPYPTGPAQHQLVLRCINASRSAYLSLTLDARCFDAYDVYDRAVVQTSVLMRVRGM